MTELEELSEKQLEKLKIDELTNLFAEKINEHTQKLIEGINYIITEDYDNFKKNMKYVIEPREELKIKKTFEHKIFKSKLMFSKADRLKVFSQINDIKNIVEFLANKLLIYRVILPDEDFKDRTKLILKYLKDLSEDITTAVKMISSDLTEAQEICEHIKDERRKMRIEERHLLGLLWNYDMDYVSRTFLYLKELIEGIMMLSDHIKNFAEHIQFLATKYLIFR